MAIDMVKTASQLLKIAADIEREASEKTMFKCASCGETMSMASINGEIDAYAVKVASEGGIFDEAGAKVDVNDQVRCSSCQGVMAYEETEESAPFYQDEVSDDKDKEKEKEKEKEAGALEDGDSQDKQLQEEKQEDTPKAALKVDEGNLPKFASVNQEKLDKYLS